MILNMWGKDCDKPVVRYNLPAMIRFVFVFFCFFKLGYELIWSTDIQSAFASVSSMGFFEDAVWLAFFMQAWCLWKFLWEELSLSLQFVVYLNLLVLHQTLSTVGSLIICGIGFFYPRLIVHSRLLAIYIDWCTGGVCVLSHQLLTSSTNKTCMGL